MHQHQIMQGIIVSFNRIDHQTGFGKIIFKDAVVQTNIFENNLKLKLGSIIYGRLRKREGLDVFEVLTQEPVNLSQDPFCFPAVLKLLNQIQKTNQFVYDGYYAYSQLDWSSDFLTYGYTYLLYHVYQAATVDVHLDPSWGWNGNLHRTDFSQKNYQFTLNPEVFAAVIFLKQDFLTYCQHTSLEQNLIYKGILEQYLNQLNIPIHENFHQDV